MLSSGFSGISCTLRALNNHANPKFKEAWRKSLQRAEFRFILQSYVPGLKYMGNANSLLMKMTMMGGHQCGEE